MERRGSKGIEIEYSSLKMAEYLLPNDDLTITEQRHIFSIRNRMINIENNFRGKLEKKICICGEYEDMQHFYSCETKNYETYNNERKKQVFASNSKF